VAAKPPLAFRLCLIALLAAFAGLDRNPVVRLEAKLGLSPSLLERLFGIRGLFSGMTEASYQLVRLDLGRALAANVLVIPMLGAIALGILLWTRPKLDTRRREMAFFALVLAGTAINNVAPLYAASS
jgi:hypothetical protein